MLGFWNSHAYITDWGPTFPSDKPPGGPFPNPTTITSYNPATGAFSGIDDAWGIGKEGITGTLSKDGSLTYTEGNDLQGTGTVTFNADTTTAIWSGTWSNSIGESGTSYGTWQGFKVSGKIVLGCSVCSAGSALPVADVDVGLHGSYSVSDTLTTDSDGSFEDIVPSGSYTVTPDAPGWTFTPPSRDVTSDNTAIDHVDFDACAANASTSMAELGAARAGPLTTTSLKSGVLFGTNCHNAVLAFVNAGNSTIFFKWAALALECKGTNGPFTYKMKQQKQLNIVLDATVPFQVEKGRIVARVSNSATGQKVLALSFNIATDSESGTVGTYGDSIPSVKHPENTPSRTEVPCVPFTEPLKLGKYEPAEKTS